MACRNLCEYCLLLLLLGTGYWLTTPDVSELARVNPERTAFMDYAQAESLKKGAELEISHIWVPLSRISKHLVSAVIIAEDDKFWRHEGFDFEAIKQAIEKDVRAGKFKFGGSTITQQLAKNIYLSPSKNPVRKLKEAALAWRIERALSKRRILELYLNMVQWGEGVFGAEAASRRYFGKAASRLDPEEAARLAAILPSPRRYDPVNSEYVKKRALFILDIMHRRGMLAAQESPSGGINNSVPP